MNVKEDAGAPNVMLAREYSRRLLIQRVAAMGGAVAATALFGPTAFAQAAAQATAVATASASPEASPAASPAVAGPVTKSITRDEYLASMASTFGYVSPENTGGEIIFANSSDMGTLNPIIRTDINALFLLSSIFNSLVTQSVVDGSMVPDLADYWEVSADFLTYTFYLNQQATFHDGTPVTADDVVYSITSAMDESGISPYRSDLTSNLASFRAIDPHTVELVATKATANFLNKTAGQVPIVPKHVWESVPVANWASSPGSTGTDPSKVIGSGPFKFVEWVQGDHATMTRNDAYWVPAQTATIDTFIYRVVADQNSAMQSLLAGESDLVGVSATLIDSHKDDPNLVVTPFDTYSWMMFVPNQDETTGTFFRDLAVRQALMYALDRDSIVETLLRGYAVRADGLVPVMSRAYAPEKLKTHYTFDVEKAKTLLEGAGWVDADGDGIREKDGTKFNTELLFDSSDSDTVQVVTYLQQAWKDVGLDIQPTGILPPELSERVVGKTDFQLAMTGITWTDEDQGILYRSDASPEKGGFNLSRYASPAYDALNDAQLVEFDDAKRMELIRQSNDILNDDVAEGVLYFVKGVAAYSARMHNYEPNAFGTWWQMPYVWVDPT